MCNSPLSTACHHSSDIAVRHVQHPGHRASRPVIPIRRLATLPARHLQISPLPPQPNSHFTNHRHHLWFFLIPSRHRLLLFFFFNDPPPPEISPLPLHAPFPI